LFSRLRSVVSGDDYLEDDYDDLDYDSGDEGGAERSPAAGAGSAPSAGALAPLDGGFSASDPFAGTNVIGMPGLTSTAAEVSLMEPRSFDEMPAAIQALRERKTIILNLTMMEPDQAQRAVDFVAGGTFAIDGHQERVGESIFLFAPSCVTVTTTGGEDTATAKVVSQPESAAASSEPAPSPAWARSADASLSAGG
jgi:cell division inhibitor SepF